MIKAKDMRSIALTKNTEITGIIKDYEKKIRQSAEEGELLLFRRDEKTEFCPLIAEHFKKFGYKTEWKTHIDRSGRFSDVTIRW